MTTATINCAGPNGGPSDNDVVDLLQALRKFRQRPVFAEDPETRELVDTLDTKLSGKLRRRANE